MSTSSSKRALIALAGVAVVLLMLRLGFWQLDRAEQKTQLHQRFAERATASPLPLQTSSPEEAARELWRPALLSGTALAPVLVLDNRVRDGVPGYEVLNPIQLADGRVVLLNRGWIKGAARRDQWPEVAPMQPLAEVKVRIAPSPSTGISLAPFSTEAGPASMLRVQRIDFAALSAALKLPLEPYQVLLEADQAGGYDRRWPLPSPDAGKHQAYAFQWFAMAAALSILIAYYSFRRSPRNPAENSHE